MIKAAVFDIDGTLAPIGKPVPHEAVRLLREIERSGVLIAMSSGKPTYYQIGMFRQVGLENPAFIGENGCSIALGVDLPPQTLPVAEINEGYYRTRKKISDEVGALCGDKVWLQPNDVMLTFFFKDGQTAKLIHDYFAAREYPEVIVYEHCDSFDIVPKNVDKFVGLDVLAKHFGIRRDEIVTVGDGVNDLPMFKYGKYSIAVNNKDLGATHCFDNIEEALRFIKDMVEKW